MPSILRRFGSISVITMHTICTKSIAAGSAKTATAFGIKPSASPAALKWVGMGSGSLPQIINPKTIGKSVSSDVIIITGRYFLTIFI